MRLDTNKLEILKKQSAALWRAQKAYDRHRDKDRSQYTQAQTNKWRNGLESQAEHIEQLAHEVHVTCVELGLAEYDESRYGEKIITSANGWSTLKVQRKTPQI
jgi:phenylalanine-4-hydroxylase